MVAFLRGVLAAGLFLGAAALLVAAFFMGLFRAEVFGGGLFSVEAPSEAGGFAAFLAGLLTVLLEEAFLVEVFFAAFLAEAFCALGPSTRVVC